ncbi:MAG: translation elongation factor Ts [Candidatus Absconditabacterales bacterium]
MKTDIQLLKQLRDISFAPMKDCKDALMEANGDLNQAQEILKTKGILKAGKRADRETKEGFIKLEKKDGKIFGLKILCETDFVAKNENFRALVDQLFEKVLSIKKDISSLSDMDENMLNEMNEMINEFIGKIGENIKIGDVLVTSKNAYIYNHPGNKVASVIYYDGGDDSTAKEIALQVAAMNPLYLNFESVPEDYRNSLLTKFKEEMKDSGKPENILNQIIDGKLKKELADMVLLEQEYIRDGSKKVKEIIPNDFKLIDFIRISIN